MLTTMNDALKTSNVVLLEELFSGLQAGLASYRSVRSTYDKRMAFDFNSVDFFWPGENKVSEILGFFLSPNKSHGQGDAFLKKFLERDELKDALERYTGSATVHIEYRIEKDRRIDIVIEIGKNDYFIGIENKVGTATDQRNQLFDYNQHLDKISRGHYFLYYLTPWGQEPSEYSLSEENRKTLTEKKRFGTLAYSEEIIDLFEDFEHCCEADNVRAFIRDFNQHLKKRFRGEKFMSESNYILEFLQGSSKRQNTALDIINARWDFWNELYQGLRKDILEYCKLNGYKIEMDETINTIITNTSCVTFISVSLPNWKKTFIEFQFGNTRGRDIFYGISHRNHEGKLDSIKNSGIELIQRHEWWVTNERWKNYHDWESTDAPWRKMIKNGIETCPLANEIFKIIEKYMDALGTLNDDIKKIL